MKVLLGIVAGLLLAWWWSKKHQGAQLGGEQLNAFVSRIWSTPQNPDTKIPFNAQVAAAGAPAAGGCGCGG